MSNRLNNRSLSARLRILTALLIAAEESENCPLD